jgi:mannose-6-phosphate isomerase-like protein (cupin superfamily)
MFYVGRFDESKFAVPCGYAQHSRGYERATLIDHAVGSVHMGVGICQLQPQADVESCVHANEKGIYILEGEIEMKRGGEAFRLSADDFALIPYGMAHAFRNTGNRRARWFEMQAPQPKPPGGWQDTFFDGDTDWPAQIGAPDLEDPRSRYLGHFKEQRAVLHSGAETAGLTVRRFIEREFGAQHFYMMRGELSVGCVRGYHDHPIEESYLVFSGGADMEIEGERFHLRPGDVAWTGVGAAHAFYQKGDVSFRWIETQAPQFPAQNGVREYAVWDRLRAGKK